MRVGVNGVRSFRHLRGGSSLPAGIALALAASLTAGVAAAAVTVRADPAVLSWSDFRRVDSMAGSGEDAHIAAEMSFPQPLRMRRQDEIYRLPSFTITVTPDPSRTTVRRAVGSPPELLRHEQGHYDIVVLAAHVLARELDDAVAESASELARAVEDSVDEHTRRAARISRRYDDETDHGRNPAAQARWLGAIARALRDRASEIVGLPL